MLTLSMNLNELKATLRDNIDRTIIITLSDGLACKVTPLTVDDEGFVHTIEANPGEAPPQGGPFWTRFEDIVNIERAEES